MRLRVAWGIGLGLLAGAGAAIASTGGPEVAVPLGWDPAAGKAYVAVSGLDESGRAARVLAFAPGGPPLGTALPWSGGPVADSAFAREFRALTARLRPLAEEPAPTVLRRTVLRADSLTAFERRWPRFRVRARGPRIFNGVLEVTTIGDPEVRVVRAYTVPGGGRIGVVSFRGLPFEDGYEVQVPALLPSDRDTLRIVREELR